MVPEFFLSFLIPELHQTVQKGYPSYFKIGPLHASTVVQRPSRIVKTADKKLFAKLKGHF